MAELHTLEINTTANGSMAAVLRAVAMSFASSAELTVDRVEDAALAINEAFRSLVADASPDTAISCVFDAEQGVVRVSVGASAPGSSAAVTMDPLSEMILSGITDDLDFAGHSHGIRFVVANRS